MIADHLVRHCLQVCCTAGKEPALATCSRSGIRTHGPCTTR